MDRVARQDIEAVAYDSTEGYGGCDIFTSLSDMIDRLSECRDAIPEEYRHSAYLQVTSDQIGPRLLVTYTRPENDDERINRLDAEDAVILRAMDKDNNAPDGQ